MYSKHSALLLYCLLIIIVIFVQNIVVALHDAEPPQCSEQK